MFPTADEAEDFARRVTGEARPTGWTFIEGHSPASMIRAATGPERGWVVRSLLAGCADPAQEAPTMAG